MITKFINIWGIHIQKSNPMLALQELEALCNQSDHSYICFFEGNLLYQAMHNETARDAINNATLTYPDGIAIAMIASLASREKFRRVSGPSFLLNACQYGLERNWRHFFLGGSSGIAEKMAENLKEKFNGIQIAGCYSPPFRDLTEEEEKNMKDMIERSHADLLWVALGGPKQEIWMKHYLNRIDVPVMLGVGAAFDFHSGKYSWAPKWIRLIGMEWLFRTVSGGKRTFFRNCRCVSWVMIFLSSYFIRFIFSALPKIKIESKDL